MRSPAALGVALAFAACGGDVDPCDGVAGACLAVYVESSGVTRIDQLQLDVLFGDRHGTTTTSTGGAVALPVATAITVVPEPTGPLRIDVVAAGSLAGTVLGTGHDSTTLGAGQHGELRIELTAPAACTTGELYCGGVEVAGDPDTVYECTAGVPVAHGRCPGECVVHPTLGNTCAGVGGACIAGGLYCGGDKLDGDPATLYECSATGTGINPQPCPLGCVVAPAGEDDACRV